MSVGIKYIRYPSVLEGFKDAKWITDSDQMKVTTGYVFTLASGAMSWKSSKLTLMTHSTMEAKLVALDSVALEAKWLRDLLLDSLMIAKPIHVVLVYCDNIVVQLKLNSRKKTTKNTRGLLEDD